LRPASTQHSNERWRRLEKAHGLSAAAPLARVLSDYEHRLVGELSDAQRQDYFRGELEVAPRQENAPAQDRGKAQD